MEDNQVLVKWEEIKALFAGVEVDVLKNAKGTAAAGVRARKGLRSLKAKVSDLVKTMVALDNANKASKKTA